jgi:hypothetical protein
MTNSVGTAALKASVSLSALATQIEGFASNIIHKGEDELAALINDAVEVAEDAAPVLENLVEITFEEAVGQFGPLASALVKNLMGAAGAAMTGTEKANLSATQLVQAAANQGKSLLSQDVTALIKNSFIAVDNLVSGALPA